MSYHEPIFRPKVACPACNNLSDIDYCSFDTTYTWWCSNNDCGKQYKFTINPDWSFTAVSTGVIVIRTKVTLKIKSTSEDIYITLMGYAYNNKENNDEYYYNEHLCPSNLIVDGLEVKIGDNCDPHGIFEYVKTENLKETQ